MTLIEEARRIMELDKLPRGLDATELAEYRRYATRLLKFAKALLAADAVITKQRNSGVSANMFPLLVAYDATLKE